LVVAVEFMLEPQVVSEELTGRLEAVEKKLRLLCPEIEMPKKRTTSGDQCSGSQDVVNMPGRLVRPSLGSVILRRRGD
jgi:hypothetical protein